MECKKCKMLQMAYIFAVHCRESACHGIDYSEPLFNTYYSIPVGSVYYPSAGMIAWVARMSGLIRNRWFLVSGDSSIGMESVSKEKLQ